MRRTQKYLKGHFDRGLQKSKKLVEKGQYVLFLQEHYPRADGSITPKRQHLSSVAEGPFEVPDLN